MGGIEAEAVSAGQNMSMEHCNSHKCGLVTKHLNLNYVTKGVTAIARTLRTSHNYRSINESVTLNCC